MYKRKLKHYSQYLKRLRLFAKAMNIKIEYQDDLDAEGEWLPSVRLIKIASTTSESEEIAATLHEIGHSMDDLFSTSFTSENRTFKAYYRFYNNNKISKNQRKLILDCEKKAWRNGRDIARRLKIRLGKWFNDIEQECLNSYKNETK